MQLMIPVDTGWAHVICCSRQPRRRGGMGDTDGRGDPPASTFFPGDKAPTEPSGAAARHFTSWWRRAWEAATAVGGQPGQPPLRLSPRSRRPPLRRHRGDASWPRPSACGCRGGCRAPAPGDGLAPDGQSASGSAGPPGSGAARPPAACGGRSWSWPSLPPRWPSSGSPALPPRPPVRRSRPARTRYEPATAQPVATHPPVPPRR